MKTNILVDEINKRRPLQRYVRIKLTRALKRHRNQIARIDVKIRDINGPKGGYDKECKIIVSGETDAPIVVTCSDSEAGRAFREALRRILYSLRQQLKRRSLSKKRPSRAALAIGS